MASPLALSRTCNLTGDFPGVLTVAAWQQRLAELTWQRWQDEQHVRTRASSLCVNYAQIPFVAPGPEAHYRYRGDSVDGLGSQTVPAVWALSVLDHIDAPMRFLLMVERMLAPGGLCFCTFAYWDAEGPDEAEGHQDRMRIYDVHSRQKLIAEARRAGLRAFGGIDWTYHGNRLGHDHTLASLVLIKQGGTGGA
jgi:SAM-dependent methyltransferase